MVVLSVAITTKTGKALLSRQFVEMSRSRIEGLLSAFPKLMGSEKQHTFIETDAVRYLYQPLENLYVLLVTNKTSNILEDLETLHLLAKIVPEYSKVLDEKEIIKNAFDIIFAFDEAVAMGYKERVTLQQIKHFISMESHDEIRHKLEEKNKMLVAKKEAEKVRKQIEKKKAEDKKFGISSMDQHLTNTFSSNSASAPRSTFASEPVVESKKETPKTEPKFSKGMQLGKGKKPNAISQILKEENVPENVTSKPGTVSDVPASNEKVRISVIEKLVLVAQNDGGMENMEVKGELIVTAFDPNFAKLRVQVNQGDNPDFQFKAHPNMNKNLYANDNILALKDSSKAFPVGTSSSILKWRFATKEEKMIPLTINVWPQTSGGETSVPVEYEKNCDFDLADVVISIHVPGAPVIGDVEQGTAEYDSKKGILNWKIPLIDESNKTGSFEFSVPPAQASAFFPVHVDFRSNQTFCALQVVGVSLEEGNKPVDFASDVSLTVEQFEIQ